MIDGSTIRKHMDVIDRNGAKVGVVDGVDGGRIKLTRNDSPDGQHHYVSLSDVARVDEHVHLSTVGLGAAAAAGLGTAGAAHAATHHDRDTDRSPNWLAWIALAAGILALLFALSRCDANDSEDLTTTATTTTATTTDTGAAGTVAATETAGVSGLGTYLAGTEAAPRTFTFETLNFDTGSSAVRDADAAEIASIAATLNQYESARVELRGFTDARGSAAANADLGKARADAIKAELVEAGIAADRITTTSGGESMPVEANATAGGRAENRRTELVVTAR